jgi:hypothetical protein
VPIAHGLITESISGKAEHLHAFIKVIKNWNEALALMKM